MALPSFMSVAVDAIRPRLDNPEETLPIISGSGFVLEHDNQLYLVTNGHIVTGLHRVTGKPLGSASLPRFLDVKLPFAGTGLGDEGLSPLGISRKRIDLYDPDGRARWLVDRTAGRVFDVVALPIGERASALLGAGAFDLMPYTLGLSDPVASLDPTVELSVVGFPFGLTGGAWSAVWVRGTVATEPWMPFQGEPCFLIDARTREGQSGSPAIRYHRAASGEEGRRPAGSWELIGVYSGRTDHKSDLGRVWKWSVLKSVVVGGIVDNLRYE